MKRLKPSHAPRPLSLVAELNAVEVVAGLETVLRDDDEPVPWPVLDDAVVGITLDEVTST